MKKINFGFLKSLAHKLKRRKTPGKKFRRPSFTDSISNKFDWSSFVDNLFSPTSRPKIQKLFLIALVASSSYSIGKIVAYGIKSSASTRTTSLAGTDRFPTRVKGVRKSINDIRSANIFNTKLGDGKIKPVTKIVNKFKQTKCLKSGKSSSLPIKLVSTTVMNDTVKSMASVQIRSKKELIGLREGDLVSSMAEIGRINRLKIIIKNLKSGTCEYIEKKDKSSGKLSRSSYKILPPSPIRKKMSGIENNGNKFIISKKKRDELLADVGSILTQAKGIPIQNPDGTMSFNITDVDPGGLFAHLDIQNGDLINSINGKKIQNLAEVMDLFGRLSDLSHLQIGLTRDGADKNLEYTFK